MLSDESVRISRLNRVILDKPWTFQTDGSVLQATLGKKQTHFIVVMTETVYISEFKNVDFSLTWPFVLF